MITNQKLTNAEQDILRAYRDNTTHNRSTLVTSKLLHRGMLMPSPDKPGRLEISRSGLAALSAYEKHIW